MDDKRIVRAAELLHESRGTVALTGAGVSTPSGIPDFRSDEGLWHSQDPMQVASLRGFHENPGRFYGWFQPLLGPILAARPNPAHEALAELERQGKLQALITQNIDGLHQRAGSRKVYELHGHIRSATCVVCDSSVPSQGVIDRARQGETPRCSCGGAYKPDVVLFDEMLPRGLYWLAQHALEQCDTVLIAGTSLEVYPVSDLPHIALRRGARLIIVNKGETHLDARADIVLRADVAEALPEIVRYLEVGAHR